MTKAVYKLNINCGRQGTLEGLFIAKKAHVEELINSKIGVYFGEVLGKHSEIFGSISAEELKMISDAPEIIKLIEEYKLENGYNPFHYTATDVDEGEEDLTVEEIIEKRLKSRQ